MSIYEASFIENLWFSAYWSIEWSDQRVIDQHWHSPVNKGTAAMLIKSGYPNENPPTTEPDGGRKIFVRLNTSGGEWPIFCLVTRNVKKKKCLCVAVNSAIIDVIPLYYNSSLKMGFLISST